MINCVHGNIHIWCMARIWFLVHCTYGQYRYSVHWLCGSIVCIFYFIVGTQETKDSTIVIAHPLGQDVELLCGLRQPSENETVVWRIRRLIALGINALVNGILPEYSADLHSNNLIIKNIVVNDDRNDTEYQCVIMIPGSSLSEELIRERGDEITLYVAGECPYRKCAM